ncbi:MAG: hypothetical protein JXL97_19330 [Bacteroidales bacterium]|nr:hypothetical protein [Bacteroidales bacterium]
MNFKKAISKELCAKIKDLQELQHFNYEGTTFSSEIVKILNSTITEIKQTTENLPKYIMIMDQNSLNDSFYKNFKYIRTLNIPLVQVLDVLVKDLIISPINNSGLMN